MNSVGTKHPEYDQRFKGHSYVVHDFASPADYKRYVKKIGEAPCEDCAKHFG